jgi:hypothetical protein
MRIITWNIGCSFGQRYRISNARTWQQLLAWDPDYNPHRRPSLLQMFSPHDYELLHKTAEPAA